MLTPSIDMETPYLPGRRTEAEGLAGGIRSIFDALRRRWRTLAAVVLITMAAVVAAVMLIPEKYKATARLRVEPSQNVLVGQAPTGSNLPDQSIVETEASVMRSHDLAEQVVRKLNLTDDREFNEHLPRLAANASKAEREQRIDDVASIISSRVDVEREKATYVVDLSFNSADPAKAARIANAFANAYIEASVNRRTGTAARQSAMLRRRVGDLARAAQVADARLAQYRAATGIADEGGLSVTDQQISPLANQVATAESEAAAARAKVAAARAQISSGGLTAVSAVLGSNVISNLRAQRAALVTQSGDITTRYGPKHPESLRIKEQLTAIDQQIKEEADRVIGSLDSEARAASARAASLRADLGSLKGAQASETRSTVIADSYKRAADAAHTAYNQAAELAQKTSQIAANPLSQAQLIEAASIPSNPSAPNKKLLASAGFVLALLVGSGTIAFQELLSAGLRSRRDLENLGLPLIASIPWNSSGRIGKVGQQGERPPADSLIDMPFTAYAEAFRSIRSTLTISSDSPVKVIALMSSLPGEGKTTTSLSLARMMALSGERTLIIDGDTRRAGLRGLVPAKTDVGLVEVLEGKADVRSAIQPDAVPQLDILSVADTAFVQSDLFSQSRLQALVADLRDRYDRIIFDTPPLLGVSDARAVAAVADAVIMVVRWDKTPANAVKNAMGILEQDNAPTVGAVFTMVDPNAEVSGALYYSDRYAAYYQRA